MNAMRSSSKKLSMHAISQFPKLNPLTIRADTYLGETACMEAVKAKRRPYKLWTRHKTDHYKELYKTARAKSKVVLDNAKKTKFREFISKLNHNTNSKEVCQIISKFNGKPFKPVEVIKQDNVRYHENKDKANVLANHYQKISSNDLLQPEFKDKKREVEPAIDETVNESISTGNGEPYNALFKINELNTAQYTMTC